MKDFDELKKLWKVQQTEPVHIEGVCKKIAQQKRKYENRLLLQTIIVALAFVAIFSIWITATFVTWTSHLAMIIVIACLVFYLRIQIVDYLRINKSSSLLKKPKEFIQDLRDYKTSRFKLNTKTYQTYVILISVALGLFAFEMYFVLPFWELLIYIAVSIMWVILCQFVFMKHYNNKESQRLQEIIDNLERVSEQF